MPEQEFPPPRRLARPYRPDRDDEEPPPWANMPSVRPARPGRPRARAVRLVPGTLAALAAAPRMQAALAVIPAVLAALRALAAATAVLDRAPAIPPLPVARICGTTPARTGSPIRIRTSRCRSGPSGKGPRRTPRRPRLPPRTRAPGGRALRAAARRRRRWFFMGGGVVVVAGAVLAVVLLAGGRPGPASVTPGALITTFQPGELRQVPNACHVVPGATVQQYLPGTPKVASPLSVDGSAASACNWTVDKPPLYRLMQVNLNAYAPNGLASGNGSATRAATDGYDLALQDLQAPPKGSPAPRATVQVLSGFGDQAFSALQVFHVGGAVTDVATVMVRYHNVVVTVTLNGLEHSNKGNYGPVSKTQLAAAAMAFARAAEGSLH